MNLKEAFRYQNKLQSLLDEAQGILDCDAEPVTVLDYNALKDDPLIEVDTIGLKGSPTNIYKSFTPPRKGSGMMLEGSGRETVERLFGILSAKHII